MWALELSARPKWRKIAEYSPEVAERVHGEAVESSDEEEEEEEEKERAHAMEFRARKTVEGKE